MNRSLLLLFLLAPLAASAAGQATVFVSVAPQAFLVEQIGGDRVAVHTLVPAGRSPHAFEPLPRQLVELAQAKLFFRVGVPFEVGLLRKIEGSHAGLRIVDTRGGVALIRGEDDRVHEHEHEQEHGGGEGADAHIWLDPQRMQVQARTVEQALSAIDPAGREQYRENLERVLAELEALDQRIARTLAPYRGQSFLIYHPACGYFADRYGLTQVAVETGGKEPGARHVAELIRRARSAGIRVVFVQAGFSRTSAQTIAREIDGVVEAIDPLAHRYPENLEAMAAAIARALKR